MNSVKLSEEIGTFLLYRQQPSVNKPEEQQGYSHMHDLQPPHTFCCMNERVGIFAYYYMSIIYCYMSFKFSEEMSPLF